ncbi:MAG: hypothetical protein IKU88_08175 [Alistipes sp.]|nr:hypothetical protein [Alistipes sp.]
MKKHLSFMMAIVLVCAMASCSEAINDNLSVSNPKIRAEKSIWEHQLDYVMEHNTVVETPLKLLGYKRIGTITNEGDIDSYLMSIYSDDAYIAVSAPLSEQKYEIFQYRDITEGERDFDATAILKQQQTYLRSKISINTHVIELTWQYKDNKFTSLALAADGEEGLFYDNIVTYVPSPRPNDIPYWKKYLKGPNKTRDNKQTRVIENDSIAYTSFERPGESTDTNLSGKPFWYYKIQCVSKFRKSDGVFVGVENMSADYDSAFPYDCKAEIRSIIGDPYSSMSHRFAWAYVYGIGTVSISFSGSGFTISGGGTGANGEEVHTIDTCSSAGE